MVIEIRLIVAGAKMASLAENAESEKREMVQVCGAFLIKIFDGSGHIRSGPVSVAANSDSIVHAPGSDLLAGVSAERPGQVLELVELGILLEEHVLERLDVLLVRGRGLLQCSASLG